MKILITSQWYPPEPSFRAHELACALNTVGHKVTVVTGFPNYPNGRIYPGYQLSWRKWENRDSINILRVPIYPSHDRSLFRRSLNSLSFAASASLLSPLLCEKSDISWVFSPPPSAALPLYWIKLLRKTPFVYEIQDLWPESIIATGMKPPKWFVKAINALNSFIYSQAAAIIVISDGLKHNLIAKGVPEEKIHVIYNWVDEELYRPVLEDNVLAEKYGLKGHFNVIFSGNIGLAQALDNVLDAAELLRDLPKVQFVFIGGGIDAPRIRNLAEERKITNVIFIDRQPAEKMPYFYALSDVLLVHLKREALFAITIPSKIMSYLACGKPILGCVEGDAAEIIHSAKAGLTCLGQDPKALADSVRRFYAMPAEQLKVMGQSGREFFLGNYKKTLLIERYESLFKEIVQRKMKGRRI